MPLTLDDLFASPDHYLHSFDGGDARFVPMDRAAYGRSIFLDGRIDPARDGSLRVPIATLLPRRPRPPGSTAWIFHVAHCGSTLLSRALDRADDALVLREPLTLRQLGLAPDPVGIALAAAMASKRYRTDRATIVKANVPVNFILPQIVALDARAAALFLYLRLDDYLLAILRNDGHRAWLRNVTAQLASHLGDLSGRSDGERAAALWLAQMRAFAAALALLPNARSLDAERFFATPAAVLGPAAALLGAPMDAARVAARVAGPLFATNSKSPGEPFDNAARLARREALRPALAAELAAARAWIARHGEAASRAETAVAAAALPIG